MISTRTIATNFPDWTIGQCKAYRAGALACLRCVSLSDGFAYEAPDDDLEEDDLTVFFLRGYADAMGEDAEAEEWWDQIRDWTIATRWWQEGG